MPFMKAREAALSVRGEGQARHRGESGISIDTDPAEVARPGVRQSRRLECGRAEKRSDEPFVDAENEMLLGLDERPLVPLGLTQLRFGEGAGAHDRFCPRCIERVERCAQAGEVSAAQHAVQPMPRVMVIDV